MENFFNDADGPAPWVDSMISTLLKYFEAAIDFRKSAIVWLSTARPFIVRLPPLSFRSVSQRLPGVELVRSITMNANKKHLNRRQNCRAYDNFTPTFDFGSQRLDR